MVLKKIIFQNRYVEHETPPPFMAKNILNFHFDYLTPSLIGGTCSWSDLLLLTLSRINMTVYCIHFAFVVNLQCNENVFVMFL